MDVSTNTSRAMVGLVALALTAAGCGTTTTTPAATTVPPPVASGPPVVIAPGPAVVVAPGAAPTAFVPADLEMIRHAAQDSAAEVRLAQLARQRSGSDAVRQLAERLLSDHTTASAELGALAQQRGVAVPVVLDPQHQAAEQRLSQLAGPSFDVAYLEQMIADHAKAVAMFERIAATAADPALRAWAARQLPILRQHHATTLGLHAQVARVPPGMAPAASPPTLPR
jgi:putative membrane protein